MYSNTRLAPALALCHAPPDAPTMRDRLSAALEWCHKHERKLWADDYARISQPRFKLMRFVGPAPSCERRRQRAEFGKGTTAWIFQCTACGQHVTVTNWYYDGAKPYRQAYASCGCTYSHRKGLPRFALREWSEDVRGRDGQCVACGNKDDLHAHHIVSVSYDPSKGLDIDNGISLCRGCHQRLHGMYGHRTHGGHLVDFLENERMAA